MTDRDTDATHDDPDSMSNAEAAEIVEHDPALQKAGADSSPSSSADSDDDED